MNRYLAVIDPACKRAEVECYNEIVNQCRLPVHYHLPALVGLDSLKNPGYEKHLAGVIMIGSAASVYDERPWQEPLHAIVKEWALSAIPTLGICYGHQAIAAMFGGKVAYHSPIKEKIREMRTVDIKDGTFTHSCSGSKATSGSLFYTHCEVVSSLPTDFIEVARSARFPHEGIKHKSLPIWGFQAHLEAVPFFISMAGYEEPVPEHERAFGQSALRSFIKYCESAPGPVFGCG